MKPTDCGALQLHRHERGRANPAAGLVMDSAGNLYGTTEYGGITSGFCSGPSPAGCGTVFKLDPSGKQTVLYSFTGTNGDGANPVAGLIMDSAGNLYGTTEYASDDVDAGTVFKLDPWEGDGAL
jgi:uncharacterized repeat protein (TIGR03803 family)